MEGDRIDPYRQFRFRVEIDGITRAGFQEVTFSDAATDLAEYREGNEPPIFRKLSGLDRHGNITFRWGITDSMNFYKWCKTAIESGAAPAKKDMSIVMADEAGAENAHWDIVQAWPVKCTSPTFNARGNELAIDALEIVCEGFTQVK
ncbi:MAG: phage tail protein [Methanoregula sp.]|jgi:phage tail-like protein